MDNSIKINKLEIENVKRVKAVKLEPTQSGLTIVGGKNNQGKTSVLDSIAWALGGNKFKPSNPIREGSVLPPYLNITLSNGLIVERKGKNSDLKITDPAGRKGGQQLLDEFVEQLALNLPKFMESSSKEKANTLLQIIGVGDKLVELETEERELYNERLTIGRIADQKKKYANEQVYYPNVPNDLISPSELIREQQEILARNGENQKKREKAEKFKWKAKTLNDELERLRNQLHQKETEFQSTMDDLRIAEMDVMELYDESTEELEKSIANIDEINCKIRSNLDKEKAEEDAKQYIDKYDNLTIKIEEVRKQKMDLLKEADMPLEELSVENGELLYKGFQWDNMSGSDQLKVATAIVRKLNPKCGFVLLDKCEQMDIDTLNDFGKWLDSIGLQAIVTRVSVGDECSIIIEDGYVKNYENTEEENSIKINVGTATPTWKAGTF